MLTFGCEANVKNGGSQKPGSNPAQIVNEKEKTGNTNTPGPLVQMIDTLIDTLHIQVLCDPNYGPLDNEEQRELFQEKGYPILPLLAVVDQCTSAIGVYSGCDEYIHPLYSIQSGQVTRLPGVWLSSTRSFFLSINWDTGFNGLAGFRIDGGCPTWIARCDGKGLQKYVHLLDSYNCLFDSRSQAIYCPAARQQNVGTVYQIPLVGECIAQATSLRFPVHPESVADTVYYRQLAEHLRENRK